MLTLQQLETLMHTCKDSHLRLRINNLLNEIVSVEIAIETGKRHRTVSGAQSEDRTAGHPVQVYQSCTPVSAGQASGAARINGCVCGVQGTGEETHPGTGKGTPETGSTGAQGVGGGHL